MAMRLAGLGPDRFRLSQNSDINVTPFVDVMLVLLIIFMVAILAATVSVKLDLPRAVATPEWAAPPTYVSLQADGRLYVGDIQTTLAALPANVAAAIGGADPRRERVYIRADRSVRYESFMQAMNALKADGFGHVSLVSEEL